MPKRKQSSSVLSIVAYTPPQLYVGVEWYIGFMAFDPAKGKMRRKKIKLNHISKIGERRIYAKDLINRLSEQLRRGWNPWIERESALSYVFIDDAIEHFFRIQKKYLDDDIIREATYVEYQSKIRNLKKYNESLKQSATYIYQIDQCFLQEFLDHIYIDRGNTAKTHDNYIRVLSVFCKFLVRSGYHKTNMAEGLQVLGKRHYQKNRTVLSIKDLERLRNYLMGNNKHFLLACYIEYYCLIRPKEMSMLKIRDISFKNQTILVSGDISKNRKDAVVTLNKKVIQLMIDLKIYQYPMNYYLFSDSFKPGESGRTEKQFRDYWLSHVMRDLKFPKDYKFYSLKDSGVTMMLRQNVDALSVRDQARHSSISITDIYTPHDLKEANPLLMDFDSGF